MDNINKYEKGSLSQLLSISFPLMISYMSGHMMTFISRLILSQYSAISMAAVASASLICYIFILGVTAIASMSEIFVGQYNGAKLYSKASIPVWQMIWFSIASSIVIYPITFTCGKLLIPEILWEEALPYFYITMCCIPIYGCCSALSGFFAATGRPKIITLSSIIANIVNLLLSVILIFGYKNIIPPLGTLGAAISSAIGILTQLLILMSMYLSKEIRDKYNSLAISLDTKTFFECIKIGYPNSIGHVLELLAWTFIFRIAAEHGQNFVIVLAIGQNFLIVFAFLTEAMQKACLAISANLIGSKDINKISKLLRSAILMHSMIIILLAIPFLIVPKFLLGLFQIDSTNILYHDCVVSLFFIWLYFFFDGMVWVISGILTSAGDTKFIMITNASCAWIFGAFPIYLILKFYSIEPYYLWSTSSSYALINLIVFTLRYNYGDWKKLILIKD